MINLAVLEDENPIIERIRVFLDYPILPEGFAIAMKLLRMLRYAKLVKICAEDVLGCIGVGVAVEAVKWVLRSSTSGFA